MPFDDFAYDRKPMLTLKQLGFGAWHLYWRAPKRGLIRAMLMLPLVSACVSLAQTVPSRMSPEKVIIDSDIGDDIDDAFAIALALRSPEIEILGISTTFGDT